MQTEPTMETNDQIKFSLEVSPEFYTTLQNLSSETHVSESDVLRKALALLKIAVEAEKRGQKIGIVEKDQPVISKIVGLIEE
ncbi:ribbon-helix-helix domain-containing protein [Planktothrix sp. FACHB-1355]|uniref:Ribbon-helix-helix domain-containing protein n=1 Tax=Aerosakkonema funiforme FACHB-1375 TaxID=2949571 RepID=A0A926ZI80_9CYAN|nr:MULTISPECIES: ribbon-helix-helix domain-containing protein [Oscillatoriales]MBD2184148.1 ribbon-helix-helix domain-containing protein [Aerosakkonema funiforme FACHB-1375]MBD3558498.1 ribbon-helix-helix domain-containing protein [Planktothrix sp. FACHB-1355]